MKILLLGGHRPENLDDGEKYASFFAEAADATDITVVPACFNDLIFDISDEKIVITDTANNCDLSDYDAIVLRGKVRAFADVAYAVSIAAKLLGIRQLGSYELYRQPSKLAQALTMYQRKLPAIHTIYANSLIDAKPYAEKSLGWPMIVKASFASHGNLNFLVKSSEEYDKIAAEHDDHSFILQEYIKNNGDYRVLVLGLEHLIIHRKAVVGSHLNNTSQGADATLVEPKDFPIEILNQSHAFAESLNMDIAGVDVLESDDGKMYFLEINSQPQLTDGAFVPEKQALLGVYLRSLDTSS